MEQTHVIKLGLCDEFTRTADRHLDLVVRLLHFVQYEGANQVYGCTVLTAPGSSCSWIV